MIRELRHDLNDVERPLRGAPFCSQAKEHSVLREVDAQKPIRRRSLAIQAIALLLGFLLVSGSAYAQARPAGPPSATVRIKQLQVAFIGSGAIGGGTLHFRNRTYEITVGGLGVGGIGASKLTATGKVYGLTDAASFAGAYAQIREGWAIGQQGRGTLWLRNANGVTMRLATQRRGLQLSLGADGVLIGFKR